MKSVERVFNRIVKNNPCLSEMVGFSQAVIGRNFSKQTISRYFNKLVNKNDYDKKDKKEIVRQLCELSKSPVKTGGKQNKVTKKES
jgi:hypothetical protein